MPGEKWTEDQIEFLLKNFETMKCKEIAEVIGKTTRAVQHKFGGLKLERSKLKSGDVVEFLKIIETKLEQSAGQQKTYAYCICKCGRFVRTCLSAIAAGKSKSCGCIKKLTNGKHQFQHGLTETRIYRIWVGMKGRCTYESQPSFKNYGAKGIKVCDEWSNDFMSFYTWSMNNGYKEELTIDRKDNNENYCPENCRWVTQKTQCNNKSTNKILTAWGETKTLAQWSEDKRCNSNYGQIQYRISVGWLPEKAIGTPILKNTMHLGEQ